MNSEMPTTCKWLMFAYNWRKRKWLSLDQTVNFFFTSLCQRYTERCVFVSFDVAENDKLCNISSKGMQNDIRALAQSNDEIDVIYLFLWTSAAGYHSSVGSSFIISFFIDANFSHTRSSLKHFIFTIQSIGLSSCIYLEKKLLSLYAAWW